MVRDVASIFPTVNKLRDDSIMYVIKVFSAIFISADKSYLTYTYPTRGIDQKRINTRFVNTLVHNSVVKTFGVDLQHFNVGVAINKSRTYQGCVVRIEKSVSQDHSAKHRNAKQ